MAPVLFAGAVGAASPEKDSSSVGSRRGVNSPGDLIVSSELKRHVRSDSNSVPDGVVIISTIVD